MNMKLYEITHGHDWRKSYHATSLDLANNTHLIAQGNRKGMNKNDATMAAALPEYQKSVFFSLGWPRATEWDEFRNVAHILEYSTEYLLQTFPCILLKSDHRDYRSYYLEYFITDPEERNEYLQFVQPWRIKHSGPSFDDHPLMKKWVQEARNATPAQYKEFIQNELGVFGNANIRQYLQQHEPYFEELLVQGDIPLSEATLVE